MEVQLGELLAGGGELPHSRLQPGNALPRGSRLVPRRLKLCRQPLHDRDGFPTHSNHLADETHDVLWIILPIWVGSNSASLVGAHLILVDHPFQRAAIYSA